MAKDAKPYKEGSGWALRRRVYGEDLYVSGHLTKTEAQRAMAKLVEPLAKRGTPKGFGPHKTTVAQAMQDMALERLPFMKGAQQESRRINRYLRAAGLATLKVTKCTAAASPVLPSALGTAADDERRYFHVELEPVQEDRKVPRGLTSHRRKLEKQTAGADQARDKLARMTVAKVQPYDVQAFMDELRKSREPATLQLERALLRGFFNYVRNVWCWNEPGQNPAVALKMPKVSNEREQVLSADEQLRLDEAIQECRNRMVGPTVTLLTETAMRSSEPLEYARWKDVDWDQKLLRLRDSKTDKRDVPLSPKAIEALKTLASISSCEPDDPIVRMSYEALKAAWGRACERAGLADIRLHDLRHTAATRMALKTGNVFLVKALTGHKTMTQLQRYINVKAKDVVAVMHAPEPAAPPHDAEMARSSEVEDVVGNLVRANFGKRRMA